MSKDYENTQTDGETLKTIDDMSGEEVVISGISGIFPKSNTVLELKENLYNQIDMVRGVNNDIMKHPNLPKHLGKIDNWNKFDAQFFRVTHWQADSLDPLARKVMECAFAAIYDSGINPLSLSGTQLGVFIGLSCTDSTRANFYDHLRKNNFIAVGNHKSMLANRISYWINSNGPSYTIDQGCASSMACLELAYNSIKRGDCEAALVGGCNTCIHPGLSLNLKNAGHLCLDGKTKCFDKKGDGYVRSEAISVLFLQKAKNAKRIYTEIYHIKSKFFTEPENFLGVRKSENIQKFLEEFYSEVTVSPSEVEYVEACGLGIAEADSNELDAVGKHFAKSNPIKVGCIKSNMGHAEGASGLCAVTKICLAYHEGKLPGNLHYKNPMVNVASVRDGRIQVVTSTTSFNRGFTAANCFSYSGANYHCLFKGHFKMKEMRKYHTNIPRLILLSGREENGMNKVMEVINSQPIDPEQIALLHNIYKTNISSNTGRSYMLLDTNEKAETVCLAKSFQLYSGTSRPVWFLYSGMGAQWCGMGTELLRIPVFAAAIQRCQVVLEPFSIDIFKLITVLDESIFDNIVYSMLTITAMQIGLTDILQSIGIVPDNFIGHSLGEVGCAYFDGCLTTEEAILLTYYRGISSLEIPVVRGSMAAVGLGYKDILPLCPPEIDVACHNSANSSTVSGPSDLMSQFVSNLVNQNIFAKEVSCSNIAYHSRYVRDIAPIMLEKLKKFIITPKLRSEKWISTTTLQKDWGDRTKYASAEYFTYGLMNPVFFEENATVIPDNAIVIEIAPHGLLQAIIRKSHSECTHITLTKRFSSNPIDFLLKALGKLHQEGLNLHVENLYPKIEFPVSTGTPLMSHLFEWEHSTDWPEVSCKKREIKITCSREVIISVHDDDYKYIKGYARNGVHEFPESALLVLVWKTLGMHRRKIYTHMSVTFHAINFHDRLQIDIEDLTRLRITIENATDRFEVTERGRLIVSGYIIQEKESFTYKQNDGGAITENMNLPGNILYNLLNSKGYSYNNEFQCIYSIDTKTKAAYIKWTGEWVTFLDSLIQVCSFSKNHDGVSTPKLIRKLTIQVDEHRKTATKVLDNIMCYKSELQSEINNIRCGGVEINSIVFEDKIKSVIRNPDVIFTRKFIPDSLEEKIDLHTAILLNLQLVVNNIEDNITTVTELLTSNTESIINTVQVVAESNPSYRYDVRSINIENNILDEVDITATNLFIFINLLMKNKAILRNLTKKIKEGAFMLTLEENVHTIGKEMDYIILTRMPIDNNKIMILLKKQNRCVKANVVYFVINHDLHFSWLRRILHELHTSQRLILISERQPSCGLFGLVARLRLDKQCNIGLVVIEDHDIPSFNPNDEFYKQQLQKHLVFNVYKRGQWGNYYNIPNSDQNTKSFTSIDVCLTSTTFSTVDSLTWVDKPESHDLQSNVVKVSYAGLSTRDYLKAIGKETDKSSLFGMDFSGTSSNGARVMGLVSAGAVRSIVKPDVDLMWQVPNDWSLEDAATVPLPYVHAYYCLILKGQVKKKETVFVTNGTEALGQAVISICVSLGINIFTSVSDEAQKQFLLKHLPGLNGQNVICCKHERFLDKVKEITKNSRFNIVINSANGYFREAAMEYVAFSGQFIDVSETDMRENENFGMHYLREARTYRPVNIFSLFQYHNNNNKNERMALRQLVANGIVTGAVRPLSRVVFSPPDISRSFQLLASKGVRGRILVNMEKLTTLPFSSNVFSSLSFTEGTHIVVCDTGSLGIHLIENLVLKGAKNIVVHMKSNNEYLLHKLICWKKNDINVKINSENLQTREGCNKLINTGKENGSIRSIFIVHDFKQKVNSHNPENDFKLCFMETYIVTANLDAISRNIKSLSNFVLISICSQSLSSEYAISACNNIFEDRRNIGLPGLIIRTMVSNKFLEHSNNWLPNIDLLSTLFHTMDTSIKMNYGNVLIYNSDIKKSNTKTRTLQQILGLSDLDNISNLTLEEMNVSDSQIEEIRLHLMPIRYSVEEIKKLTLLRIEELWKTVTKGSISLSRGLAVFYNYVDKNEYNALDLVVPMKTLLPYYEEHIYMDRYKSHLIMIPGFDGHNHNLVSLTERLKIPTATLQLGPDIIHDSIPNMATYLANHIKLNFHLSNFYLLGYSFGVIVALEVAKILESEGLIGVVYCLDSSPDALKSQLTAYLGNLTDGQLQHIILEHMYYLMTGRKSMELKQDLLSHCTENWSTKVNICMRHLKGIVYYSNDFQKCVLESAYNRIKLAKTYECDFKLKSELILIKGIFNPKMEGLNEDYNLSKYTESPVRVFPIESDHASAPYNNNVPHIVNKRLDPCILQDFKRANLCEFYYME